MQVKAGLRWATECMKSKFLKCHEMVTDGLYVLDVLHSKLPEPFVPPSCALLSCSVIPHLEETEVTRSHVHFIAQKIQGTAGYGACDALHSLNVFIH